MGSSGGGGTPKEPRMPDVPAGKKVPYGSASPVIPTSDAYTSYLTPGQTASGGVPVNRAPGGISGAPSQLAASTAMGGGGAGQASQAPPGAQGRMSEIERINKLIAMGAAPKDILAILLAAKDPEPDDDIFFSQWGGGGSRYT